MGGNGSKVAPSIDNVLDGFNSLDVSFNPLMELRGSIKTSTARKALAEIGTDCSKLRPQELPRDSISLAFICTKSSGEGTVCDALFAARQFQTLSVPVFYLIDPRPEMFLSTLRALLSQISGTLFFVYSGSTLIDVPIKGKQPEQCFDIGNGCIGTSTINQFVEAFKLPTQKFISIIQAHQMAPFDATELHLNAVNCASILHLSTTPNCMTAIYFFWFILKQNKNATMKILFDMFHFLGDQSGVVPFISVTSSDLVDQPIITF